MAVLSVTRKFTNESGRELDDQGRVSRDATVVYEVIFDGPGTTQEAETASAGANSIPSLGAQLSGDPTRHVIRVRGNQIDDNDRVFRVSVTYSNRGQAEVSEDPLARPPEVYWDFEESREPMYLDANGDPIENSAGTPYDPPVEGEVSDPVMVYIRNEASFNAPEAIAYKDAVNDDTFTIYGGYSIGPGVAKMRSYTGRKMYENGVTFWQVTRRVAFRPYLDNSTSQIVDNAGNPITGDISGWMTPILDQGLMRKGTGATLALAIRDDEGRPVTEPRKLNGLGQPVTTGPAVFRLARLFRIKPFGPLNLT
jgi:hypothetical protein